MSPLLLTLACGPYDHTHAVLYCQPTRRCGDNTRRRAMAGNPGGKVPGGKIRGRFKSQTKSQRPQTVTALHDMT